MEREPLEGAVRSGIRATVAAEVSRCCAWGSEPDGASLRRRFAERTLSWGGSDAETTTFCADKTIALEEPKAAFCCALGRVLRARGVVECGTSTGVSTLYLLAALRGSGNAIPIATEREQEKATTARRDLATAGLADDIDLRVGDLTEPLNIIEGEVDFVLLDVCIGAVTPPIRRIVPLVRENAIIVADNTP